VSNVSARLTAEIKILGFQSPDNLKIDENIKHSYFIYPDETVSPLQSLAKPRHTPGPPGPLLLSYNLALRSTGTLLPSADSEPTPSRSLPCSSPRQKRSRKTAVKTTHPGSTLSSYLSGTTSDSRQRA
jgi:hypothetical protein